jgi:hypothetical protein
VVVFIGVPSHHSVAREIREKLACMRSRECRPLDPARRGSEPEFVAYSPYFGTRGDLKRVPLVLTQHPTVYDARRAKAAFSSGCKSHPAIAV